MEENRDSIEALMEAKALMQGYFKNADGMIREDEMLHFLEEVSRIKQVEKEAVNWSALESNEKLSHKSHSVVPTRSEVALLAQKGLDDVKFKRLQGAPESNESVKRLQRSRAKSAGTDLAQLDFHNRSQL